MKIITAWALVSLGIIALTGVVFYLTGSGWAILILFFIPKLKTKLEER